MKQQSLFIIKPDAVSRNIIGKIISKLEDNNIKLLDCRIQTLSVKMADLLYEEHYGNPYYNRLINYMTSSESFISIVYGDNVIEKLRKLCGNSNPLIADIGTIRKEFGLDLPRNSVHSSDSIINADKEIAIFF